jgi:F-type H+-transporting ATPase subunit b
MSAHEGVASCRPEDVERPAMPQLHIQDFAPQLVWLAISFVLLYFLMSRLALPEIGKVLDDRKGRIAADLSEAARLRDSTEAAITAYDQALAAAKSRAQGIARAAREEMNAEIEKQRAEIDTQINGRTADAEQRITTLKEAAIGQIGEIAVDTAEALVARFTGKPASRAELVNAVNEVLGK